MLVNFKILCKMLIFTFIYNFAFEKVLKKCLGAFC